MSTRLLEYETGWTSPNQSVGFDAQTITIHWWGDPSSHRSGRIDGVASWLCNPAARASAHFVASGVSARLACLISLSRRAWHSANSVGNRTSVGIEMHPFDSATPAWQVNADLNAAAYTVALTWHWRPKTRGKRLKGHKDWHNTACPGTYYPLLTEIHRRASKLYPHVLPDRPGWVADGSPIRALTDNIDSGPVPDTVEGLFGMTKIATYRRRKHTARDGKWTTVKVDPEKGYVTLFVGPGNCLATVKVEADIPEGVTLQGRFYEVDFKSGQKTKRISDHLIGLELTHTSGNTYGGVTDLTYIGPGREGRSRRLRFEMIAYGADVEVSRIDFDVMGE